MTSSPVARRRLLPVQRGYPRRWVTRVVIPVVTAVAAVAARDALAPILGQETPFITLFPAVAVAAWAGGLIGGLVAALAGGILAIVVLLHGVGLGGSGAAEVLRLLLFTGGALTISALGGHLHEARDRAEGARARADFLADASAILAESLDTLATVEALAQVAVPAFTDWCAIDLVDEAGRFTGVRIAHADPQKVALGYRLRRERPLSIDDPQGPGAVLRTGEPEWTPAIPRDLPIRTSDPELGELLTALDIRSYICVPLVVRGKILGTLTALMSESDRRFGPEDLAVARDLGARAGVALDHARLYRRSAARGIELDRIIAAMDDGVLVADADGTIRSHNPAAVKILGVRPTTLADVEAALVPGTDTSLGLDVGRVAATGRFVRRASLDVEAEGETSTILVLRDVTEVLESRLAHDTFVGMLSHEVRTPITTIYGTAQVLLRPLDDSLRADLIRDLASETDRLYRLVEDLLVLSRYERDALDVVPEPVLLQRLLPRVTAAECGRWPHLTVDVEPEPDLPPVVADATYVEQIVRNLVGNGAKYGGPSGHLTVRAFAEGDTVTVEVEDEGPGIPDGEADRIFELYERLPSAQQSGVPGAGIGLFVCKRLVDVMGGRIGVRNGPRGAIFSFSLPRYVEVAVGDAVTGDALSGPESAGAAPVEARIASPGLPAA